MLRVGETLERLRRRKIFQWAAAYLAAAWVTLEVTDVVSGILDWPATVPRVALVLLAFGFPLVLVLAWYHGEKGHQRVSGAELLMVAGILVLAGAALTWVVPTGGGTGPEAAAGPGAGDGPTAAEAEPADGSEPVPDDASVAVLPFTDMSPEGNQEYFADGIAEELLSTISQLPGVRVAARTSSFALEGSDLDVTQIGRRLRVATVVEGSVRKSGDRLRIEARLIDASDGFRRWSETYDAELSDIFSVQREIARSVADALRVELTGAGDELRLRGQTDDPEAQDLYLRGRFEWNRRTRDGLEAAVDSFQAALERDPDYARALVGLADAYAVLGFYDYWPPAETFPAAKEAATRALEIEPGLAEPHATLGYVALYYDWNWETAEAEFRRAIALDPTYPVAHQWYANHLVAMGRFEEAGEEVRAASELDPLSRIAHAATGWVYYYAGEYGLAVRQLRETVARDSTFELGWLWMGQAQKELGRLEEAERSLDRVVELSGKSVISRTALAHLRALQGRPADARRRLVELEARAGSGYVPAYEIARVYAGLGELDTAVRWLERAREERGHSMAFLAVDPQLRPLHGHPRYERLVRRMGLEDVVGRGATPSVKR